MLLSLRLDRFFERAQEALDVVYRYLTHVGHAEDSVLQLDLPGVDDESIGPEPIVELLVRNALRQMDRRECGAAVCLIEQELQAELPDPVSDASGALSIARVARGDALRHEFIESDVESDGGSEHPLRVADPFAGAPDYPLVGETRARVEAVEGSAFATLQTALLASGRFGSTTGTLLGLGPHRIETTVFDQDARRREAWEARPGVRVLAEVDGWDALHPDRVGAQDLVLVDPYDLGRRERWSNALAGMRDIARSGAHLVLYLYNRGAKSPAELKGYRAFRVALEETLGSPPALVGRVPSDALLPRAWHEMLLLQSPTPNRPLPGVLVDRVAALTETLAWTMLRPGVIERSRG